MSIQNKSEIEKLNPQLQGQLVEALELLKDVVDEAQDVCPNAIDDIRLAVLQILKP
jgi:hypothetical protein